MANVVVIIGNERFDAEVVDNGNQATNTVIICGVTITFKKKDEARLADAIREYPPKLHGMKIEAH